MRSRSPPTSSLDIPLFLAGVLPRRAPFPDRRIARRLSHRTQERACARLPACSLCVGVQTLLAPSYRHPAWRVRGNVGENAAARACCRGPDARPARASERAKGGNCLTGFAFVVVVERSRSGPSWRRRRRWREARSRARVNSTPAPLAREGPTDGRSRVGGHRTPPPPCRCRLPRSGRLSSNSRTASASKSCARRRKERGDSETDPERRAEWRWPMA